MKGKQKVIKSDEEWKKILTQEQYHVLCQKGTERPFTGEYDIFFEKGIYYCSGCKTPLFGSDAKYDSGCGWPAFFEPIDKEAVLYVEDNAHGMKRIEVVCANCGGHLGHVFNDGPQEQTGLRYCINSISLDFDKKE